MTDRPTPTDPPEPANEPVDQPADTAAEPAVGAESSGSRWEQQPAPASDTDAEAPGPVVLNAQAPVTEPVPERSGPTPWARRLGLAGAAAALVAVGGVGGFALGHATADEGDDFRPASFPFDRDGDGDHHRFDGGQGPGFAPPGQEGQLPQREDDSESDSESDTESGDTESGDTENSSVT